MRSQTEWRETSLVSFLLSAQHAVFQRLCSYWPPFQPSLPGFSKEKQPPPIFPDHRSDIGELLEWRQAKARVADRKKSNCGTISSLKRAAKRCPGTMASPIRLNPLRQHTERKQSAERKDLLLSGMECRLLLSLQLNARM